MTRIKGLRAPLMAAAMVAVAGLTLAGCNGKSGGSTSTGAKATGASSSGAYKPVQIGSFDPKNTENATFYASVLRGSNEVSANGTTSGPQDGTGLALMRIQDDEVSFAFTWKGIDTPTMAHIHVGTKGVNGGIKIRLISKKLPSGSNAAIGTVKVTDEQLLSDLRADPEGYFFNIHTAKYPNGALRGQVYPLPGQVDLQSALEDSSLHPVVKGAQVYACAKQADGTYAFVQNNVDTTLTGGIRHTFVKPGPMGPPQWVAPDKSSVQGKTITKVPNGTNNIPELVLQATQTGKSGGDLSATRYVLRLDTVGGVAPTGACNPSAQPTIEVPYHADYLFLG